MDEGGPVRSILCRVSPWAITRFMWSSGSACSHTVVQCASSRLKVAGSDTRPPGVAITAIVGGLYITNVGLDEVFNPKLRET